MMITKTDGSKNVCLDSYEEENFQGSDDDHVPRTFEEFEKAFRSTSSKNTVLEPQSVDSDTEEKVVLELQNTPLSSENSDLEMEEEYIEEENSNEELSFEGTLSFNFFTVFLSLDTLFYCLKKNKKKMKKKKRKKI